MKKVMLWLAGIVMCTAVWAQELKEVPPYAPVTDLTDTLTTEQQQALTQKLLAFERERGSELAVVLIPTTKPEPIEDYADRLATIWKLGREGIGDGVVFVVATADRASRIEVAKALEGAVPDLAAKRILRQDVTPAFKRGDFYEGINRGLDSLMAAIEQEGLPPPSSKQTGSFTVVDTSVASLDPRPGQDSTVDLDPATASEPTKSLWRRALELLLMVILIVAKFSPVALFIWLGSKLPKGQADNTHDDKPSFSAASSDGNTSSPANDSSDSNASVSSGGGGEYGGGGASDRW